MLFSISETPLGWNKSVILLVKAEWEHFPATVLFWKNCIMRQG
jgi:hypothetical protein